MTSGIPRELLPAALCGPATPDGAQIGGYDDGPDEADALTRLIATARAASGESIAFLLVGDRLDRDFVERHLSYRQYGALVGVTCSYVRLVSPNRELVHQNTFAQSGAWAQAVQQIPSFATGLRRWHDGHRGTLSAQRPDAWQQRFPAWLNAQHG